MAIDRNGFNQWPFTIEGVDCGLYCFILSSQQEDLRWNQ